MADPRVEAALASADERLAKLDRLTEGVRAYAPRVRAAANDMVTRISRAVGVIGAAGVGAIGYGVAVAPIGIEALLIGVPVAGVAAIGAALLPARRAPPPTPKFAELPAAKLASTAREWFDRRRIGFPTVAVPATKRILDRLAELGPLLAKLGESDPMLADARRLLADHLPRLVDAWAAVPAPARANNTEVDTSLATGLGVIADELDRLWTASTQEKVRDLAVEGKFLATRYGDVVE